MDRRGSRYQAGNTCFLLQKANPHMPAAALDNTALTHYLDACQLFLTYMKPVNTYIDHFKGLLQLDYEHQRVCAPA